MSLPPYMRKMRRKSRPSSKIQGYSLNCAGLLLPTWRRMCLYVAPLSVRNRAIVIPPTIVASATFLPNLTRSQEGSSSAHVCPSGPRARCYVRLREDARQTVPSRHETPSEDTRGVQGNGQGRRGSYCQCLQTGNGGEKTDGGERE